MNVTAVLLDLDGTLLDHDGAAATAAVASFPEADPAFVARRWVELTEAAVDRYLAGELTFTEQRRVRITALARELGLGAWDDARADAWLAGFLRRYEAAWRAYPDVRPAVAALARRGLRLGVITNGDAVQQRAKLKAIGLDAHLPYVLTSSEAGVAKPAAEIFLAACAALRLRPAETAYVGDRLATDARAAADAGLHGVWLDRDATGPDVRDEAGVVRVTGLDAVVELVGRADG